MTDDLFGAIDAHLRQAEAISRGHRRFRERIAAAHAHYELWDALRPFITTRADYDAAVAFVAAWTRQMAHH